MNQENSNDSSDQWWETKCVKCKQEFSESEPKLLSCLHTLCNSCVSADSTCNASLIICPLCRQECKLDDVIVNQFIKECTSQNDVQKTDPKVSSCTNCEDDAATTSFCTDCAEWLCDVCVQAHLRVRVTKDHTIQSKEEVMGDQNSNVPQKILFCPTHKQEPLKVFCESCDCLTCRDCQLTEHREHRYQFVSEASHHHKLYLQTLLEKLREKKTYMEAAKTLIGKRYKDIAEREQTVTNEIKMFAIRFITEINRRGKQLLAELHEVCSQKKAALGQKNTELTSMSEKLDHCLNFVESAISRSSDVALLYSKRTITNQLRNVLRSHCEVPNPNHVVDIRFVYENAFLSNYINQLGCLMVDNLPYHVRSGAFPSTHVPPASVSSNSVSSPASRTLKGISFVNKEMMLNMFGAVPNPNQPHVSSSTHPADAQRNIRLRSLLEQAPAIPPHAMRSSGPFIPPSGIPKNQASQLMQNNSALCRMLINNQTAGRVGNMWHSAVQKNPLLSEVSNGVASSSGTNINIHPGKIQSLGPFNRVMPSQHPSGNNLLSLSNTQRLSHYPALCSSAPAASVTSAAQELRMPSPQSSQSSPALNSGSTIPIQITNIVSQKSPDVTSWHNNAKVDVPSSQHNHGKSQERNVQSSVTVKQEITPSNFPSCSVNRVNIKQEIIDDAQEIADTARHALRFFCDDTSMSNIMGSLKSLHAEGQHDSNNEVELAEGQNTLNNNVSPVSTKTTEGNQEADKVEKNSVQQADSSCSPGLLLVDCHTNDSSLENGLTSNKGISTDNEGEFNCNTSLDHEINSQLNCKINTCHESQNQDPNDDWCAVCHDGGNLLCCGFCPRVYHLGCHIPTLSEFPGQEDQWQCLLCRSIDDIHKYIVKDISLNIKRKNPVGLSGHELRICERVLLELFCHEFSSSFHHPVSRAEAPDYHKIINSPMDLSTIKKKLSPCHFNHYDDVQEFLDDFKLMFKNCFTYNEVDTVVYNAGKKLEEFVDELVNRYLPSYVSNSASNDSENEPPAKKKKTDCVVIW